VEDLTELMLFRLGVTPAPGAPVPTPDEIRRRQEAARVFGDIPMEIEALIGRMVNLLLVEISAAHLFAWAEELLADDDLVAGDGVAARLVSYIRQDESPHVDYLRTALSEMKARTFTGARGHNHEGADVIDTIWDTTLAESLGLGDQRNKAIYKALLDSSLATLPNGAELREEHDRLGATATSSGARSTT
jgi:hypothetical protein